VYVIGPPGKDERNVSDMHAEAECLLLCRVNSRVLVRKRAALVPQRRETVLGFASEGYRLSVRSSYTCACATDRKNPSDL